jgi:hypothetical protein
MGIALHGLLKMAEVTIRHRSYLGFFREGAAERAAKAALDVAENGCGQEAIIDAMAASLNRDFHVCLFDDPCDVWAA